MVSRRTLVLLIVVFAVWSPLTLYYYLGSTSPQPDALKRSLEIKLSELENTLQSQAAAQIELIKQISSSSSQLLASICKTNTKYSVPEKLQTIISQLCSNAAPTSSPPVDPEDKAKAPADSDKVNEPPVYAVLMIACDRVSVAQALDQVIEKRPSKARFPLIVSQDCGHAPTKDVINSYKAHIAHFIEQPDQTEFVLEKKMQKYLGYYKIARHYKFALDFVFLRMNYSAVIIVEDDLNLSPDFFEYMEAGYPLLMEDESLWCVSAWNDNGKEGLVDADHPELLYRSDFFPGLGWMMRRKLWLELGPQWPNAFWDDWMRESRRRKGRACLRPELSRTSTFGKKGVSKGLFFDKHLKFITHYAKFVGFRNMDLNYLLQTNYDRQFKELVEACPIVSIEDLVNGNLPAPIGNTPVRVRYTDAKSFKNIAKSVRIMDDFKAGVPRTAYMGVVSIMFNGRRVFVVPPEDWSSYDPTWT